MALSDININQVVEESTNTTIYLSSYTELRQYTLDRKPLLKVMNVITPFLSEHCTQEKLMSAQSYTQAKCQQQYEYDLQETISDQQEKNSDQAQMLMNTTELPTLRANINQLSEQSYNQQLRTREAQSRLAASNEHLSQIENSIRTFESEISSIIFRSALSNISVPGIHDHVHSHGTHHHHHAHVSNGALYPNLESVQNQLTINRLDDQKLTLLREKDKLTSRIAAEANSSAREEGLLTAINDEHNKATKRLEDIELQMKVTFPNKETARQNREKQRAVRYSARMSGTDSTLQQLSEINRNALTSQIRNKDNEIERHFNHLNDQAKDMSYTTFRNRLEQILKQTDGLSLSYAEHQALAITLNLMNAYLEMEEKENSLLNSINDSEKFLGKLQGQLSRNREVLERYKTDNPVLADANTNLRTHNDLLIINSALEEKVRTTGIVGTVLSSAFGIFSGALIGAFAVSPLLFVIPAILALVAVAFAIVAIVYHVKKLNSDEQYDNNSKTIIRNNITITQQVKDINSLNNETIPNLQKEIASSESTIAQQKMALEQHQTAMSQHLAKIQNIVPNSNAGNDSFFGGNTLPPQSPLPPNFSIEMTPQEQPIPPSTNIDVDLCYDTNTIANYEPRWGDFKCG